MIKEIRRLFKSRLGRETTLSDKEIRELLANNSKLIQEMLKLEQLLALH